MKDKIQIGNSMNERNKGEWFESWFESDLYDLMYKHRNDQEAQDFLERLLDALKPNDSAIFLDLACGTGRHSRYIHSRGYQVTGIDLSKRNIKLASAHEEDGLEFYIQDMRKPFRRNYFNYVLNLFTSFGYFDDVRDNVRVIRSVKSSLKKNGIFVIDYMNDVMIKKNLITKENKKFQDWSVEINRQIDGNRLIKNMDWRNADLHRTYDEKVTLFSLQDFTSMLTEQGFSIHEVYGNYDLSTYDKNLSPRMIIVSSC